MLASPISFIMQGLALGLTAAAAPGSLQAYLIHQSLTKNIQSAAPAAFGPLIGDIPIVMVVIFLLARIPAGFIDWLMLAGGLFAFYLASKFYRSWRLSNPEAGPPASNQEISRAARESLSQAVMLNLISPYPYTFWALVNGPILIEAYSNSIYAALSFLVGFYGAFIGSNLVLVAVFSQMRRLGGRIIRVLSLFSILILLLFGVLMIWSFFQSRI